MEGQRSGSGQVLVGNSASEDTVGQWGQVLKGKPSQPSIPSQIASEQKAKYLCRHTQLKGSVTSRLRLREVLTASPGQEARAPDGEVCPREGALDRVTAEVNTVDVVFLLTFIEKVTEETRVKNNGHVFWGLIPCVDAHAENCMSYSCLAQLCDKMS